MRKPNEDNIDIIDSLIKQLSVRVMSLDDIRELTGWQGYRCIIQHIDTIGDNYPIFEPIKGSYKILTASDFDLYA